MFIRHLVASTLAIAVVTAANAGMHGYHQEQAAGNPNIVEIAAGNDNFETLVVAIKAAGLQDTLQGKGPYTVFAPTDEAFAALPEGTLEYLLKEENKDQLIAVLTYHVVPGSVMAVDVVEIDSATTVQGSDITVTVNNGSVMVDDARVVKADISASNGVIHVIDKVILPKS